MIANTEQKRFWLVTENPGAESFYEVNSESGAGVVYAFVASHDEQAARDFANANKSTVEPMAALDFIDVVSQYMLNNDVNYGKFLLFLEPGCSNALLIQTGWLIDEDVYRQLYDAKFGLARDGQNRHNLNESALDVASHNWVQNFLFNLTKEREKAAAERQLTVRPVVSF